MELTRVDYVILKFLKKKNCTSHFMSATKQLNTAITNGLLQVTKAECSYKSSNRVDELSKETFIENLQFLCESGVFADFVDWHYEKNISTKDEYILDSGAMNPYSENVVTVYLRVADCVDIEDIEKIIKIEEE